MNQEPILDQLLRDPDSNETLMRVANSKLDDFTMSVPDDPRLLVRPSVDEQIMLAAAARKELENRGLEWRPKPVPNSPLIFTDFLGQLRTSQLRG